MKSGKKRKSDVPQPPKPKKAKRTSSLRRSEAGSVDFAVSVDEREETFPRSGQASLTALEKRVLQEKAKQDVSEMSVEGLVERETGDGRQSIKKKAKGKVDQPGSLEQRMKGKSLQFLSLKKLTPGLLLLGVVQEVHRYEVLVSLPFNTRGYVGIGDVSDSLTALVESEAAGGKKGGGGGGGGGGGREGREGVKGGGEGGGEEEEEEEDDDLDEDKIPSLERLFFPGAVLACCVTDVQGWKVSLSVNPRLVNSHLTAKDIKPGMILPGVVRSIEDHGYIIDFGVANKNGFLLKKNTSEFVQSCNGGKPLVIGQVVQCLVLPGADARSLPLSVNPSALSSSSSSSSSSLLSAGSLPSMSSLLPGFVVNASVKEVASNGLVMSFLGGLEGVVNIRHLSADRPFSPQSYQLKRKLKACLLWVDVLAKAVGLSLSGHLVNRQPVQFQDVEIGDIYSDASIVYVDPSHFLVADLGSGHVGFSPLSLVYDERKDSIGKPLSKGTRHTCRVVQFNLLDGFVIVSFKPSIIERPFMKFSDLRVGGVVKGTVERHGDFGMIVSVTEMIRGLVPSIHLADVPLKNPRKRLKEQTEVKCRVLTVEPEPRRLLLTSKKSLVKMDGKPLCSYEAAQLGSTYAGVITSVHTYGCIVHFFGGVRGKISRGELSSTQVIFDPRATFSPGQVVQCKVISCDVAAKRLVLSLRHEEVPHQSEGTRRRQLKAGDTGDFEVTGVEPSGVNLRHCLSKEMAFLPTLHLSDYAELCPLLLGVYQKKLEISAKKGHPFVVSKGLVVACKALGFRPTLVTMKRTLVEKLKEPCLSFSDLEVGQVLTGFVRKVVAYGCFVEFPGNLCGLAPVKHLTDKFVSDSSGVYQEMQTVLAKVLEVDGTKERFLLTLRPSDLKLSLRHSPEQVREKLVMLFEYYLQERDTLLSSLLETDSSGGVEGSLASSLACFQPGHCLVGEVLSKQGDKVVLELEDGIKATANSSTAGEEVTVGSRLKCCMLDLDLQASCVVVSLNPKLAAMATDAAAVTDDSLSGSGRMQKTPKRKKWPSRTHTALFTPGSSLTATVEYNMPHYLLCSSSTVAGTFPVYGICDSGQMGSLPTMRPGSMVNATVLRHGSILRGAMDGHPIVEVTAATISSTASASKYQGQFDLKIGDIITAVVQSVQRTQLNVKCGLWKGRVHGSMVLDEGFSTLEGFSVGEVVKARVVGFRKKPSKSQSSKLGPACDLLELTMRPSLLDPAVAISSKDMCADLSVGQEVSGAIAKIQESGMVVQLSPSTRGWVPCLLASQDIEVVKDLFSHFTEGDVVKCTVMKQFRKGLDASLSLIGQYHQPKPGSFVVGSPLTKHHQQHGRPETKSSKSSAVVLLVSLPFGQTGRVDITDLSDVFVDDNPIKGVQDFSFLKCYVLAVGKDRIDLSLRKSRTGVELIPASQDGDTTSDGAAKLEPAPDPEIASVGDLHPGQVVRGYVKAVTDQGSYVHLGRNVDGRVKITYLTDGFVKDFKSLHPVGKLVKAKVLKVDYASRKVELSLRLSHVDPEAAKKLRKSGGRLLLLPQASNSCTSDGESLESSSEDEDAEPMRSESEEEEEEEEEEEREKETVKVEKRVKEKKKKNASVNDSSSSSSSKKKKKPKPFLMVEGGLQWGRAEEEGVPVEEGGRGDSDSEEEEEEEEEREGEEDESSKKKTKRQKKAAKRAEEEHLYLTERAFLDSEKPPESAEDFERLLVAHPNSSSLWVQLMAFHLHTADVDRARATAERALKTISFREEQEKLNVWVALMNLENSYGTHESLLKAFQDALQQNEPFAVFQKLAAIYVKSQKFDLAEQLYQTMTKRFPMELSMWNQFGLFLMKQGKKESARALLERSLKRLPGKQQHVDVISKFAQHEFKFGDPERGRTMFERLLSSYPKRVDLWNVYADMVLKLGELDRVREIFERAIHLKASAMKIKSVFKRYLDFEKTHGSQATVELVKQKAKDYVETKLNS